MEVLQSPSHNTFMESHHPDIHGIQRESITLAPEVLMGIHHPGTQGAHGQSIALAPNTPMEGIAPWGNPKGVRGC